eukprot:s3312_g1.t2
MYDTGTGWLPSDIYTWPDMIEAVKLMASTGVGQLKLWLGDTDHIYGLVNVAAFLAQCMQETIQYNACDENNWSDNNVVQEAGGSTYSATSACGQLHQSYQDYSCSAEEDAMAGGRMACEADDISHRVMEDNPLLEEKQLAQLQTVRSIAMNLVLCTVNLLAGCLMPAVADRSRTALVFAPSDDGKEIVPVDKRFPYNPATLIMGEAVANIAIGMTGMILTAPWLRCTLASSDPVAGINGHFRIMKQRLECFQWILLASITTCIVIFATGHVRSEDESSSGASVALLLALLKSFLSALAAVLTETRYKQPGRGKNWPLQLCPEHLTPKTLPTGRCIKHYGWDRWTWTVLLAEVSNGWLSVAILTRLSAIAKFVCKAACAPSLYVAYCFLGWNQFKPKLFASVLVMTISIVLYAKESIELLWRHCFVRLRPRLTLGRWFGRPGRDSRAAIVKKSQSHSWTAGYRKPGRLEGAKWYGAPAKLFCAPKSKVPKAPRWDYSSPWCPQEGGYGYEAPFPDDVDLDTYFQYVNEGGGCKDYQNIKTGGWKFTGSGCDAWL